MKIGKLRVMSFKEFVQEIGKRSVSSSIKIQIKNVQGENIIKCYGIDKANFLLMACPYFSNKEVLAYIYKKDINCVSCYINIE